MSKQQIYLSQIIEKEYKSWKKGDVIIFNSPTGTGKTSTCILLAQSLGPEETILYITSRIAKLEEFKSETADYKHCFLYTTYQKLEQDISYMNYPVLNQYVNCTYIFIDECHYFTDDIAMPNSNASLSEEWLRKIATSPIKIYASATADRFYSLLKKNIDIPDNHIYTIEKDYSYVKKCLIYKKEQAIEILNRILAEEADSKILFFVNNTDRMAELVAEFGYDIADYLCSANTSDTYLRKLCNITNAQFASLSMDKRMLFATKTIDIGVNIKDESLKYIFCEMQDPTTIIQCLGRKRPINENDSCIFYICDQNAKTLALHNTIVKKYIEDYESYVRNSAEFIVQHKYDRNLNKGGSVFILTPGGQIQIDKNKMRKYKFDIKFYEYVKKNGFMEALKLFLDDYLAQILTRYVSKDDEVIDFLHKHEGTRFYKEDKNILSGYFSSIIKGKHSFGINVINNWLDENLGEKYKKRFMSKKDRARINQDGTKNVHHNDSYWVLG